MVVSFDDVMPHRRIADAVDNRRVVFHLSVKRRVADPYRNL